MKWKYSSLFFLFFLVFLIFPFPSQAWNALVTGGRCQTSRQGCRSTVGNAGGAGACCDPLNSRILHCISTNACKGGNAYRWFPQNLPLKWEFQDNGRPDGFAKFSINVFETALKKAWDGWTQPACTSFRHQYLGRGGQSGSRVVIYLPKSSVWALLGVGNSTLAFATPRASRNGALSNGSIYFNPRLSWGIPTAKTTSNDFDFTEVAHHEIGHVLGFAHSPYRSAVMYFQAQSPGANYNGPQNDDINAVCTTYPLTTAKSCTKDSDCASCGTCQQGRCVNQKGRVLCSCSNSTECQLGLVCKNQLCQKDKGGTDLDPCNPKARCQEGYSCIRTPQGHVCLQTCQDQGGYPPGTPGSPCRIDGTCNEGNECFLLEAGRTVCLKTCQTKDNCTNGGNCQSVNLQGIRQSFCLCGEQQAKCTTGKSCNSFYLSGPIGVCTQEKIKKPCAQGLTCTTRQDGLKVCLPPPGKANVGESCFTNQSCSKGLICAQISATEDKRVCVESCTGSDLCRFRGQCRPAGDYGKLCFCYSQADCGEGRTCERNVHGKGVCTAPPNVCGNAICEPGSQETCVSCPGDCACPSTQVCSQTQNKCIASNECGNGTCEPNANEDCVTCAQDCKCKKGLACRNGDCVPEKVCGDGECDESGGEDCSTCAKDCKCPASQTCQFGLCIDTCGDGACNKDQGENCSTCAKDCSCTAPQTCQEGTCKTSTPNEVTPDETTDAGPKQDNNSPNCPKNQQERVCENGTCKQVCQSGCGCNSASNSPNWLLAFCLLLLFGWRRQAHR